jgi:DNA-directed RNA polymerase subunit RPC12/RpoP
VAKRLGEAMVRMLGYNGSIPGPTLTVRQGSEIIVPVTNGGDRCPQCGMKLLATAAPTTFACPMHPEVTSDQPGRCPKCGMKLMAAQIVTQPAPDGPGRGAPRRSRR